MNTLMSVYLIIAAVVLLSVVSIHGIFVIIKKLAGERIDPIMYVGLASGTVVACAFIIIAVLI